MIKAAAVSLMIVTAGCVLAWAAFWPWAASRSRLLAYVLAYGPLLGFGVASLALFYARLLELSPPSILAFVMTTMAIALLLNLQSRWSNSLNCLTVESTGSSNHPYVGLAEATALTAVALSGCSLCFAFITFTTYLPDGSWDSVAIWNLRARFFFHEYWAFPSAVKELWAGTMPTYPMFQPGAVSAQYFMLGFEHRFVPAWMGLVITIGVGALVWAAVIDWGNRIFAAAAVALLWSTPVIWQWGFGQVADVPTAYCFLGAFVGLASLLPRTGGTPIPPSITGISLGLLTWSKNEGIVMAAYLLALFVVVGLTNGVTWRKISKSVFSIAITAIPGAAAVIAYKALWVSSSGVETFLPAGWPELMLQPDRWTAPTVAILQRLVPVKGTFGWAVVWPVLLTGLGLALSIDSVRRRPAIRFWGAALVVTVLSWTGIYVLTRYPQDWHIATSLDRLMVQIYPVVIVGVFSALGSRDSVGIQARIS